MVVLDKSTLSFEDGNGDGGLLVLVGGEGLGLLGGDDSSTRDNLGHNATDSINTKSEGSNVNQEDVLGLVSSLTSENTTLHSSSVSNSLIGVNATVGFFAIEEVLHE